MPCGELVLTIMASIAQFERARIKEPRASRWPRRRAGGAKRFSDADIRKMHADGMGATEIMHAIGAESTSTVYGALNGASQ